MKTVCVSFINSCPWTTGHHVHKEISKRYNTIYSSPQNLAKADWYLFVDSGHEIPILSPKEKTLFYSIDTYQNELKLYEKGMNTRLNWWLSILPKVHKFFDAFEFGHEWLLSRGVDSTFISMGIDKDLYHYKKNEKQHDIIFVGGKQSILRQNILEIISKNYDLYTPQVYSEALTEAASKSRCFLEIPPVENDMLGQRFFEGYACGIPMVAMDIPRIRKYLNDSIFLYNIENLEESLKVAINLALESPPVERDISSILWSTRLQPIFEVIDEN